MTATLAKVIGDRFTKTCKSVCNISKFSRQGFRGRRRAVSVLLFAIALSSAWLIGQSSSAQVNNGNQDKGDAKEEEKFDDLRALKCLDGQWNTTIRIWTGKSGEPPIETKGSSDFKSILNGKFIRESNAGKIGKDDYEGVGYWGYDEQKKKFTRVWLDSLSSATVQCEGSVDHSRSLVTLYGKLSVTDKETPEKLMRWELDYSDTGKIVLKMFDLSIHKDAKVFEIVYEKKEQESK